jgi:hypothetical protein
MVERGERQMFVTPLHPFFLPVLPGKFGFAAPSLAAKGGVKNFCPGEGIAKPQNQLSF